jgi:hypothetical protein
MKDFAFTPNKDEYYRDQCIAVDCVELLLPQPRFLCSGGFDIEFASPTAPNKVSNTYQAQGDFIGFSSMTEDFDVKVGKFSIFLSGLNQSFINTLINQDIEGQRVAIYKAFLSFGSTGQSPLSLVATPIMVFDGIIYNFSVTETRESCQVVIDCSSLFADFERTNGRKTNNWSNWLFQDKRLDLAFEQAGFVGQTEYKWGRL